MQETWFVVKSRADDQYLDAAPNSSIKTVNSLLWDWSQVSIWPGVFACLEEPKQKYANVDLSSQVLSESKRTLKPSRSLLVKKFSQLQWDSFMKQSNGNFLLYNILSFKKKKYTAATSVSRTKLPVTYFPTDIKHFHRLLSFFLSIIPEILDVTRIQWHIASSY